MTRPLAPLRRAAACLVAFLAAPALALADVRPTTGGTSAPPPAGAPALVGGVAPTAAVATPAATGPDTLAPPPAMSGSVTLIPGRLTAAAAGRPVTLSVFDPARGFVVVASGQAGAAGGFLLRWRARHLGRFLLRASLAGHPAPTDPVARIEVYRSVVATWFGPGSYGSRTACGQILTPTLLGVAHRTLPCGTMVDIVYGGQTITVPVVDRGPYASGVSLDLTTATATALRIADTVHLGALAVPAGP